MDQPEEKEETTTADERCYLSSNLDGKHIRKSYGIRNGQSLLWIQWRFVTSLTFKCNPGFVKYVLLKIWVYN